MASGVKLLFSHQFTSAAATVMPVLTSCSSCSDSMGSTEWPVQLSSWLVRASASAAVRAMVEDGRLSAGHARAILAAPTADLQRQAAKQVLEHQLSVRQTEALIKALQKGEKPPKEPDGRPDLALYLGEVEKSLSSSLGRKVTISHKGKKGRIQLEYYDDQDLESLLALLQQHGGGVESL